MCSYSMPRAGRKIFSIIITIIIIILKYKDLIIEIQRIRNVKTKMVPVIREATGTISKSL
jgi:hypothetical protein